MKQRSVHIPDVKQEFDGVDFSDSRLDDRCHLIVDRIKTDPETPFPQAMGNDNDTQGFYRFCANQAADMATINTPHFNNTARRIDRTGETIVCHDTTTYAPASASQEDGFYEVTSNTYGLNIHLALASDAETGLPLGVAGGRVVDPPPAKEYSDEQGQKKKRTPQSIWRDPDKQSRRWFETVTEVEERVEAPETLLHLLDSDADSYEAFAHLCGSRFICRLKHNRKVPVGDEQSDPRQLFELLDDAPVFMERQITVGPRKNPKQPKRKKTHPSRESRLAKLEIHAQEVTLQRPGDLPKSMPESLTFNAVAVREIDPPEGCKPISWNLLTSEPITTAEEVTAVVDNYAKRWRIEEYYDVLKNGCALSKRLPESRQSAEAVIALLIPMAWQLLWLRQLERQRSTAPADLVFPKQRLRILRARLPKGTLPPRASVRHVLAAIAQLGGHLSHNGPPGWRVLWRGYKDFTSFERGWRAAQGD